MMYGRHSLTLEEVQYALKSKELKEKIESKERCNGEGLTMRGRKSEKKDTKKISKSKSPIQSQKVIGSSVITTTKKAILGKAALKGRKRRDMI